MKKKSFSKLERTLNYLNIWETDSNYTIEINESVFKNLEEYKSYTLKELGLESD